MLAQRQRQKNSRVKSTQTEVPQVEGTSDSNCVYGYWSPQISLRNDVERLVRNDVSHNSPPERQIDVSQELMPAPEEESESVPGVSQSKGGQPEESLLDKLTRAMFSPRGAAGGTRSRQPQLQGQELPRVPIESKRGRKKK